MAASTSGALKAQIEGLGLNISAFRDRAPEGSKTPYVTIDEAVAIIPDSLEDGAVSTGRETVTIHIWQAWKNTTTGQLAESYTLPGALVAGLQGTGLSAAPTRAYAVLIQREGPRMVEEEENLVHIPITAVIWRSLV